MVNEKKIENDEIEILKKTISSSENSDSISHVLSNRSSYFDDFTDEDYITDEELITDEEYVSQESDFSDEGYFLEEEYFSDEQYISDLPVYSDASPDYISDDYEPINIRRCPIVRSGLSNEEINKFNRFKYKEILTNTNECRICFGIFEKEDTLIELSCFHLFHATCLISWLMISKECPMCKMNLG